MDGWVRRGHLEVVAWGVLRLAGGYRPPEQPILAHVMRAGPKACADGAASLALHGVEGFALADHVGVLVQPHRSVTGVAFSVRPMALGAGMTATVRKVPALVPGPAFVDAAAVVAIETLRPGVDDGLRRGLVKQDRLLQWIEKLHGHPGARILLDLFAAGTFEQENDSERALARFLEPLGLELEWQVDDLVPGRRLDAVCRPLLLVIESDSRAYHLLRLSCCSRG